MTEKSEHIIRREHYVAGREDERERIIALLESISFLEDYPPFNYTIVMEEAIALIKGENV